MCAPQKTANTSTANSWPNGRPGAHVPKRSKKTKEISSRFTIHYRTKNNKKKQPTLNETVRHGMKKQEHQFWSKNHTEQQTTPPSSGGCEVVV